MGAASYSRTHRRAAWRRQLRRLAAAALPTVITKRGHRRPLMPYNRGNVYFDGHGQQYERAIGDFSRVIELDGSFALAYFNRGLAQERLGDNAAAATDYRRALALDATAVKAQRRLKRLQSQ